MKILILAILIINTAFAQSVVNMISNLSALKTVAEETISKTPYRVNEHQVLKNYFVGVKDFSNEINDNSRSTRGINNYLMDQDMALFCNTILIDENQWNQIKINCTRNRFFLCAEEVMEYTELKKTLGKSLSSEIQQIYFNTLECK